MLHNNKSVFHCLGYFHSTERRILIHVCQVTRAWELGISVTMARPIFSIRTRLSSDHRPNQVSHSQPVLVGENSW